MKNAILSALETYAPAIPNQIRYLRHVRMKQDFVYQAVTQPLFHKIGAKDKVAVDVGANVGIFTRYLVANFGHTIAVEPLPDLASKIDRIFGRSVQTENCALGSTDGTITIRTPLDANGTPMHALTTAFDGNDLKMFEHIAVREMTVAVRQLDMLNQSKRPIGFVKIDVEGFELEVLKGASKILSTDRPILMIEISKGHNPNYAETLSYLDKAGYTSYVLRAEGLATGAAEAIERQPLSLSNFDSAVENPFFDFLFVPQEMSPSIANFIRPLD
jgi:FkbM family methyltransferase